ncbi:hypothetical protein L1049_006800 [Liquidambar formosana]|uniref:Glycosyltransferase 61 catalytic domain-containing protein n=1 Tax=Liquidambar formosana TaxID=63359 RepID=A0AAP0RJD6_LIQFO
MGPNNSATQTIRPYPRKAEESLMGRIKELTLTSGPYSPSCEVHHNAPALVFSAGGYTGNFFHDFNDGFIPLFITVNSLFRDQNIILVITNCKSWWSRKYAELLTRFSRHPIIDMDKETASHCFPSAIVGLISHGPMTVDPTLLPHPKTILDFHNFLESAYSQGNVTLSDKPFETLSHKPRARPQLVLVNRRGNVGRVILNQEELKQAAEDAGFDVTVFEPTHKTRLVDSFRLIHASHAILGVHGAALTHSLFLRPGSVLVQVVPIGTEWLCDTYFAKPAKKLGLKYMEYKIRAEESSLVEKYGKDDIVLKDPKAFVKGNWSNMHTYLKAQDVKLDIHSFQRYLRKAYKQAKRFMNKES